MQALRAGWDFFQNEILGMKSTIATAVKRNALRVRSLM